MATQFPHRDTHSRPPARQAGRHLGRLAAVLGVLTCALVSFAGAVPAAFASPIPVPGPGGAYGPVPGGAATVTRLIMTGGMPGWQIALIAAGAALVAAASAVAVDRTVGRRRLVSASMA